MVLSLIGYQLLNESNSIYIVQRNEVLSLTNEDIIPPVSASLHYSMNA